MRRSCLLIGAPGSDSKGNFLKGVSIDMHNMRNFLTSETGGAWNNSEILEVINPSISELKIALTKSKLSDFSLILFSGHGGTSTKNKRTYLEINTNGDDFPAEGLINHTSKELVIVDTCRSYFTPRETQFESVMKALNEKTNLREKYRKVYEKHIEDADPGSLILYACSIGETANDTNEGGIFTKTLIETGLSINKIESAMQTIQTINTNFYYTKILVNERFKSQNPTMEGSLRRNKWYPFAIKL
ncbi:caspase family protein [Leptospira levettii]|uniref:caspase family protein n=1 Tax=Leptospira levettii TaxID=2023178 RepID=UPI00223D9787|nr:caspase family protein [Leptospira levettii]MCW7498530.1 caspase family protein [Leptospira levettii]